METNPKRMQHIVYHSVLDQWRIVHASMAVEEISLELPMVSVNRTGNKHRSV